MHIYIGNGLLHLPYPEIHILEVGFGTGLNALATLENRESRTIYYDTVEAFPLSTDEVQALNYVNESQNRYRSQFYTMHACPSGITQLIEKNFYFRKWISTIQDAILPSANYDLVYFDCFGPTVQPELWTEEIFRKIYHTMRTNGILITYCAKGSVKRALKAAGFVLESLPGPTGKREITRATRPENDSACAD